MPDNPNQGRDTIWASFRDYLQEPYADNPRQRAVMQRWYDDLRSRQDIDLTHAQISNLQNGRSFNAYVINQQVLLSHDVGVLSTPFPRSSRDVGQRIHPDQLIAGWLHDMGGSDDFHKLIEQRGRENKTAAKYVLDIPLEALEPGLKPQMERVLAKTQTLAADPKLPGGATNQMPGAIVRYMAKDDSGMATRLHRDIQMSDGPNSWARNLLHPLNFSGTVYTLDANNPAKLTDPTPVKLTMPVGVTCTHCTFTFNSNGNKPAGSLAWGTRHQAPVAHESRATFMKGEPHLINEVLRDEASPWQVKPTEPPTGKFNHGAHKPKGKIAVLGVAAAGLLTSLAVLLNRHGDEAATREASPARQKAADQPKAP